MATSKYSIVMSVYKNDRAEWLRESVDSLLNQTLKSDDIVIVVDGPIGQDLKTCLSKYESYKEISIIKLRTNTGLGNALNKGIQKARHELIGRMDSDDIARPTRFEQQVQKFNEHSELDILGGHIAEFSKNKNNIVSYRKVPITQKEIQKYARRRNPFNHPTVMFKRSTIVNIGYYNPKIIRLEDYDLWLRAISNGASCLNADSIFVDYRLTSDTLKRRKTITSLINHVRARWIFYLRKDITLTDLVYGVTSQASLFILPNKLADLAFKRLYRNA